MHYARAGEEREECETPDANATKPPCWPELWRCESGNCVDPTFEECK